MSSLWVSAPQVRALLGDGAFSSPVYADLARRLRLLVVDGRLSQGVRMPSERDLCATLHLSRSTVAAGYAELREQGYLRARRGSGNFVALPGSGGPQAPSANPQQGGAEALGFTHASAAAPPELDRFFAAAVDRLPALLRGHGYYADGIPELRTALAEWFTRRGLPTSAEQLVITAGALSALNIVARTLVSAGDRVLVESPSYPNAITVLRQTARPVAYPLPATGWEPRDFELTLRQSSPAMSYLIPEFHNPSGLWMSEETRPAIAAALQRHRSTAVIDEALVDLALDGEPMRTPLAAYLPDAVTIGSASKAFWGGLRIGWIRAPRELVRPLVETRALLDLGAAPFEQLVVASLLTDDTGVLERHRRRLSDARNQLRSDLSALLPDWQLSSPAGGLSLWVTLPDESSSRLAMLADRHGLVLTAGPRFFVSGGGERQLRLPYTAAPDVLADAAQRLARLWSEVSASRPYARRNVLAELTA